MKLPQAIRGMFKRADEPDLLPEAPPLAAPPGPDVPPPDREAWSETARLTNFEGRLRTLTQDSAQGAPPPTGRLQMITLTRVKERLGEGWSRMADKVHRRTQQILERRLTEEDVYLQVADRYMILFAKLTGEEATFKAQAIAREITTLLLGELPGSTEAPLQVTVHEIDPAKLSAGPTMASLEQLGDVADRETATFADPAPVTPEFAPRSPTRFDYPPIWSRRGKAIVGYACVCRQGAGGEGEDPYDLDYLALQTVLATLPDMERNGHAALVMAPIHWATLMQLQRRQGYLELCRQLPRQMSRQLGFSISELAAGAWHDLIRDRLLPLRAFARFFIVCMPPEPAHIRNLADIGVDALAFDVAKIGPFDDAQRQRIEAFAHDAARHKLATCALGINERSTALALLAAEVDFLSGDGVAPCVDAPGAAYRLDLAPEEATAA